MRATIAILAVIVILFVGIFALNSASTQTKDAAVTNGTNASEEAHNLADDTFGGLAKVIPPAIVYGGVAVLVLLSGLLLAQTAGR